MSLLTDMSIKAILGQTQYTTRGHPFPASRQPLLKARAVADNERALTLKAVAEWLEKMRSLGFLEDNGEVDAGIVLLREGKMPGEE